LNGKLRNYSDISVEKRWRKRKEKTKRSTEVDWRRRKIAVWI
jgi:hypothetical protein